MFILFFRTLILRNSKIQQFDNSTIAPSTILVDGLLVELSNCRIVKMKYQPLIFKKKNFARSTIRQIYHQTILPSILTTPNKRVQV